MKHVKASKYLLPILIIVLLVFPSIVNAQPGFGDDVDDVPVDGGLSLLVAAGVGYGVKKLKRNKKENK